MEAGRACGFAIADFDTPRTFLAFLRDLCASFATFAIKSFAKLLAAKLVKKTRKGRKATP
jgi:hypothetical protein